jgi:hypothetical protein
LVQSNCAAGARCRSGRNLTVRVTNCVHITCCSIHTCRRTHPAGLARTSSWVGSDRTAAPQCSCACSAAGRPRHKRSTSSCSKRGTRNASYSQTKMRWGQTSTCPRYS